MEQHWLVDVSAHMDRRPLMPVIDLFVIANGFAIGSAFFLAAAGVTILFGILRILNFAHGSFLMVGAYLAHTILSVVDIYNMYTFLVVALVVGFIVGVMGLIVDRIVFRRLHGLDEAVALIATFALMLVVNGVVVLIWGAHYVSVDAPRELQGAMVAGSLFMPSYSIYLIVVGLVAFVLLDTFLHRSWTGKVLLAVAEDRWITGILGHSPRRLELLAVFLAFFLAGFGGAMLVPNQILTPELGNHLIIQAFAVVIVGGLGSVRGSFLAAMVLGMAESIGALYMPSLSLYLGMILILILRPQGLIAPKNAPRPGSWSFGWLLPRKRYRPSQALNAARTQGVTELPHEVRSAGRTPLHPGLLALAFALLLSVGFLAGEGIIFVVGFTLISVVFAMSWNLMFGFTGVASFGHAAFFAVGAYVSAYMLKTYPEVSVFLLLPAAMLAAGIIALPVGIVALRRATGVQLAILTLALAEVLRVLISYTPALGRDEGLSAIPRPVLGLFGVSLQSETAYYFFILVACSLMFLFIWAVTFSSFGRILRSIRQDPQRALFLGINVDRYRLMSFVLAAAVAAFAGALAAPLSQIVTPAVASVTRSTEPMLNTLLGGAWSFWGPAVGTFLFAAIDYGTRTLAGLSELVTGGILLGVVLLAPRGAVGLVQKLDPRGLLAMVRSVTSGRTKEDNR